jgi:hypothetical protein
VLSPVRSKPGQLWQPPIFTRSDDAIALPEFGLRRRVSDLYRGTPLGQQRNSRISVRLAPSNKDVRRSQRQGKI